MKVKIIIVAVFLAFITPINSIANEKPIINAFTISKPEIDLNDSNLDVSFEVIFTHPNGISDISTRLTLTNSSNNTISIPLNRIDLPVNFSNQTVTYRGSVTIPRSFTPGVYTYSLDGVSSNLSSGLKIHTGVVNGPVLRNLKGAESGLLIRESGNLNLDYPMINGPSYGNQTGNSYNNVGKYLAAETPIWKVGEVFDPNDYFESSIDTIDLKIETTTPTICTSDGKQMKFIAIGDCSFTVSTSATKNYQSKTVYQSQAISRARSKQILAINKVENQHVKDLPISMMLSPVFASGISAVEYIIPKSVSPEICEVSVYSLKIFSGGKCLLTYQSRGNAEYFKSDLYTQTITIDKILQTISFTLPSTLNVSNKLITLAAKASSGAHITYSTSSTGICSITGSTLNLLRSGICTVNATQIGDSTFAPISVTTNLNLIVDTTTSKKVINCTKGTITKKISGIMPKCPNKFKMN